MFSPLKKLIALFALALAVLFVVGALSAKPAKGGTGNCTCTYSDGGLGQSMGGSGGPSCEPNTIGFSFTWYTEDDGACIREPDCTDPWPCMATGRIWAWSDSPCYIAIMSGGMVKAVSRHLVGTEFSEELDCGSSVTYYFTIGSVPMYSYTNTCLMCPL